MQEAPFRRVNAPPGDRDRWTIPGQAAVDIAPAVAVLVALKLSPACQISATPAVRGNAPNQPHDPGRSTFAKIMNLIAARSRRGEGCDCLPDRHLAGRPSSELR